jgi:protein-S-isoprenylcysteine O-methyltransferase Ste14
MDDEMKKLSRWGIGPKMALLTIVYSTVLFAACFTFPGLFEDRFIPYPVALALACALFCVGAPLFVASYTAIDRSYQADVLNTQGVYRFCRHPLYASFILFIVPGIALLIHFWLLYTVPLFLYIVFRVFIRTEETYLEKRFGNNYIAYRARTNLLFPRFTRE